MTAEPWDPPFPGPHGLDKPDLDRRPYARHDVKYYIWADHFGGGSVGSRAVAFVLAGLLVSGACSRTSRTIILDTPPSTEVRGPEVNRGPSTAATLGAPPGHQPKPKSRPCPGIATVAPAGSWIIYRPTDDKNVVHIREVDSRRPGTVIRIRIFDIETSRLLREENP